MPVFTRSRMGGTDEKLREEEGNERNPERKRSPIAQLRNPHHGLKERLRELTLLYEQQKQASAARRELRSSINQSESKPSSDDFVRENAFDDSNVKRKPLSPVAEDFKENVSVGTFIEQNVGFSCPRNDRVSTTVARKLSIGNLMAPYTEPRQPKKVVEHESEKTSVESGNGNNSILVFVRLRPMGKKEKEAGSRRCVRIVNKRVVYLTEHANDNNDYLRLKRLRGRHFTFDASFPESTSQQEVYFTTTAELVEAVLQGRNGSVFCYGATGAGKTYTMLGTVANPGVMVLAIKDLFSKIRQRSFDGSHAVHLSYLEVYNETVRDLLSPGRPLVLREDKQGIVAAGVTQYRAYSTDEVMELLQQGNLNRTTEPTRANETSSRSHAILQVMVEFQVKDAADNIINQVGKLSLIDLAGSERALATEQRTLRSLEGANINKSLLALSSCINALVEGKKHIPYRNSKLTQLLKDSLGGTCNTVMIANISPSNLSFGETQNTLHWADRAKMIRSKLQVRDKNEEMQIPVSETDKAKLLLELQKENRELRIQLAHQQQKLLTMEAQALAATSSAKPASSSLLSSTLSSVQPNGTRKRRPSLASNCLTPEPGKKGAEKTARELRNTVKALETEIEKMRKDHLLQMKQKDETIQQLSRKVLKLDEEGMEKVVTRASLRPKRPPAGDIKSPNHRFLSPAPTAKKRCLWDITTAASPSLTSIAGRKTRNHVTNETPTAPSMLLKPGFARAK